jgi:hypothetical protein
MAMEVDDEYWVDPDPDKTFKQPPGKPSSISFFNAFLKLHQIAAFALRTIVSSLDHLSLLLIHNRYSIPSTDPKYYWVMLALNGNRTSWHN